MKKLLLASLLGLFCCVLHGQDAETVQARILSYLSTEGFRPETDKDGDIVFKSEGLSYYVFVEPEKNGTYYYTSLVLYFNADDTTEAVAAKLCNTISKNYKIVQCFYTHRTDTDKIVFSIAASCFIRQASEFENVFPRLLDCTQEAGRFLLKECASDGE